MTADADFGFDRVGLRRALELLGEAFGHHGAGSPVPSVAALNLPPRLPAEGIGATAALEQLAGPALADAAILRDAGFLAHMDPPTPWMTWAAAMWAASMNQNLLHPDTSPAAQGIERTVLAWLSPYFGMDGGHLVPGSSVANLTALWVARELRGITEVVCSTAAHVSIHKAASLLGLQLRVIPTRRDETMDVAALGDLGRAALVITAGTVAAGAIEDLTAGPHAAWRHIDAAWGGALRLSSTYQDLLAGINTADSVSLSAHKWLFQPKECAAVMFADTEVAHRAISFGGVGYLARPNIGVLGSHGACALPLLVTLLAWGEEGVGQRIDRCMQIATDLAANVDAHPRHLELFAAPSTGVVVWRPRHRSPEEVRAQLERAFVSFADVQGRRWFRSVAANPMADPQLVVDQVLRAIRNS